MSDQSSLIATVITHGRHCTCSPCKREDWAQITAPCGMHGHDCPAVWSAIPDERRAFAVRLDGALVKWHHGEPLTTREQAEAVRQTIESMFGERGRVVEVEWTEYASVR